MIERTLSIIKPDAFAKGHTGEILSRFEKAGLALAAMKTKRLTEEEARRFYVVHKDRPFYDELVAYMTSGPVLLAVLEGDNAVSRNRELMGATNPKEAAIGTIRKDFGTDLSANAVHGSDSLENAQNEVQFFFAECEILGR